MHLQRVPLSFMCPTEDSWASVKIGNELKIPVQCISIHTSNHLITPIHSMAIFQLIKVLFECELAQ